MHMPAVVPRWRCKTPVPAGFVCTCVSVELPACFVRSVWCWDNRWKNHIAWIYCIWLEFCFQSSLRRPWGCCPILTDTAALPARGTLLPCSRSGSWRGFRSQAGSKLWPCGSVINFLFVLLPTLVHRKFSQERGKGHKNVMGREESFSFCTTTPLDSK